MTDYEKLLHDVRLTAAEKQSAEVGAGQVKGDLPRHGAQPAAHTSARASCSPPATRLDMLARLRWEEHRACLDNLVFWIQDADDDVCQLGDECFRLYKCKGMIDLYAEFWAARAHVPVRNAVELGIWDGGSAACWFEFFQPDRFVAFDFKDRQDSDYFNRYRQPRGIESRLRTFWGVYQADAARLRAILDAEFTGPLDLVIDDASHLYEPTRSSFETLFPRVRPGGYYIIEDWAWEHWPETNDPDHKWAKARGLSELVCDLAAAVGSRGGLVRSLSVGRGFIAVERGEKRMPAKDFNLDDFIVRRSTRPAGGPQPRENYGWLVNRVREIVEAVLPPNANVLVVSKGDPDLLELGGRKAMHFPQGDDGHFAGEYPADDAGAIAALESPRARQAEFLVFPETAQWWLDHYADFRRHLESNCRRVLADERICTIFDLRTGARPKIGADG